MPWDQNAFLNAVAAKSAMQRDQGAEALMHGSAAVTGANAQAHLHDAQAQWTGPKTQSEIGVNTAQGGYYGSLSNEAQQRANAIPGNAAAQQHLWNSEGSFNEARTPQVRYGSQWLAPAPSVGTPPVNAPQPIGGMAPPPVNDTGPTGLGDLIRRHLGLDFAEGTSHIAAPGDGTVDTTKANLANGEAVLNKGAAEHLGQPAIRALNAIGAARMGMVPGKGTTQDDRVAPAAKAQEAGKPGHYAKGTSKAGPKGKGKPAKDAKDSKDSKDSKPDSKDKPAAQSQPSSSDTPSLDQIDPKMLAAAMQMGALGQQGAQPDPQQQPQPQPGQTPMGMM